MGNLEEQDPEQGDISIGRRANREGAAKLGPALYGYIELSEAQ